MKGFKLPETPLNIQKCLLPDSEFLQKSSGRYCLITLRKNEPKLLVKLGLFEIKTVSETFFFDDSVMLFNELSKVTFPNTVDVSLSDFTLLKSPVVAQSVRVTVVFTDIFGMEKFKPCPEKLIEIIREMCKMLVLCNKSCLKLSNYRRKGNFDIELIIITASDVKSSTQPYEINLNTKIEVEKSITKLKFDQICVQVPKTNIFGNCEKAYEKLKELVQCAQLIPNNINIKKNILIVGPRGSGKSTLIYNVAFDCKCILLEMSVGGFNVQKEEEKEVINLLKKAELYSKCGETCVVLIKNIHLVCGKKYSKNLRLIGNFLDDIEKYRGVLVMATTNSLEEVDMELRKHKRFEEEVEISVPDLLIRETILRQMLSTCSVSCDDNFIRKLAKQTPGFVVADLKLLVMEAILFFHKKQSNDGRGMEDMDSEMQYQLEKGFELALKRVIPSGLRGGIGVLTSNEASFGDIGGLDSVKRTLDLAVKRQLENPEKFRHFGVPLTRGILLYGPPGCAKTTLAKALAQESQVRFLATSAAELYSPYVGDAEKKVSQLFAQARANSPAIIFIDEIDAVVGNKCGERERGVQERILSTLLVEMDGIGVKVNTISEDTNAKQNSWSDGVIVIGATNNPQALDEALKRPGRFDKLIYIPPPDENERLLILQKLTRKMALDDSVDLKRLAELTTYYSGADLKNLCRESGLYALNSTNMAAERIYQYHFEHVIKELKPSLNEKMISFYESFQKFNL